jgi:hypothetical protein
LDLSYPRFDLKEELTELPGDVASLITGVAARQAASPTAQTQARFGTMILDPRLFAPVHGAFNGSMAAALTRWREE